MNEIREEFKFHKLNPYGQSACNTIAVVFSHLLDVLDQEIPGRSRERALFVTNLEAAAMWLKRHVSQDPGMQQTEEQVTVAAQDRHVTGHP